jgi:phosphoribosylformimino-5-aminoimidazole carboxamide ribotide isomerase
MLLIIPAIDLTGGQALRCIRGVPGTEELYSQISEQPVELAQLWRRENAKCLHVTDIDSWKGRSSEVNDRTVVQMQKAIDVPVQYVTRRDTIEAYERLLQQGVYRVALNVVVWTDPDGVRKLLEQYGTSRVIFGVRAHDGQIDLGQGAGSVSDVDFILRVQSLGGKRVLYTEVDWEGKLTGEDLATIRRVAAIAPLRMTMAGGVASPQQLWEMQKDVPVNVDSVVIGRAMYENRFPCQAMWREIEADLEPGIHAKAHTIAQQSSLTECDTPMQPTRPSDPAASAS